MKTLFLSFLLEATALWASAQSLTTTLIVPPGTVRTDAPVTVELVTFNSGDKPGVIAEPATLHGTLNMGSRSWSLELQAAEETKAEVAPGAFVSRRYRLDVPADVSGRGVLEVALRNQTVVTAVIDIAGGAGVDGVPSVKPTHGSPTALAAPTEATSQELSPDAENAQLGRTFAGRMAAHEPVYFVYGNESQAAKFQFSFKYKLAEFSERTAQTTPSTLQVAYTQRSLWDINGDSSPFYDTSYMPEVFWEWMKLPIAADTNDSPWFGVQAGIKHESNGRDGLESRSLNTAFARAYFAFGPPDGWRLGLIPEIFAYVGGMGENGDIDEYRGYGLLRAVVGKSDGPSLMFTGMAGKDFNHASFQLDLSLPVRTRFLDMSVFFLVQYYNGYGESLRSYNLKSETLRAGFSLVR